MLAEIFGLDAVVVIVIVLAVLFGGAAIPKLARNLGSAQGEFKKGMSESKDKSSGADATATDVPSNGVRPDGTKADAKSEGNNPG
jgi:sec-independent protein translocase protein TatA